MDAGRVQMLLIVGEANPVYSAPADLKFGEALQKVAWRAHSGLFYDETAELCQWHVPSTHYLEMWSDARSVDGTVSIVQPLLQPMYGGKSPHEIIATLSDRAERNGYDVVREYWAAMTAPAMAAAARRGAAAPAAPPPPAAPAAGAGAGRSAGRCPGGADRGLVLREAVAQVAARRLHRRLAGDAPRPVALSRRLERQPRRRARRHRLRDPLQARRLALRRPLRQQRLAAGAAQAGDQAHLGQRRADGAAHRRAARRAQRRPADGQPCRPARSRCRPGSTRATPRSRSPSASASAARRAGRVGTGVGVDAYALRGSDAPWIAAGDAVKAGGTHQLVSTQDHWSIEGRNLVRSAQLEEYKSNPKFAHEMEHMKLSDGLTLYPKWEYSGYAWGMAIDLNTCTGCNACVVACQAENNIPVVGKDQVANGREMQWLRIDRYYSGDLDSPDTYYQPMPCQQCENAPCEVVCPVAATVHSDEGLNDMVYNRCVGTRYCSNNCPWKVRRFNFTLYQDWETPQFKLQRNPDVTVRSRGIMEKCTYCVQRINSARIQAKREDREIRDGEVVTACESACPTQAITFGNLNDPTAGSPS